MKPPPIMHATPEPFPGQRKLDWCEGCLARVPYTELTHCEKCGGWFCPACAKQHVCGPEDEGE